MKTHIDIKHEGTLSAEGRVRMTFDENSITHLMSVLTDLYSDPAMAVVREYSTNAYDAHRAAGNDAPIEVSSPNSLNPIFVVKDYGTGMTVDEICQQFSKYGWSSKRETDEEVGMLGLGCKSALTYTSQFTLVSIKDGLKATVLVTRDDDGTGAVQIIDTVMTEEPNGVEVRVPVKNVMHFTQKIREFFRFWDKGTVRVDGIEPDSILDTPGAKRLDEDIHLVAGLHYDYVVMGQVAYPVESGYNTRERLVDSNNLRAIVRVPIGSINFTPSREALQYTKRTEEVLNTAREYINNTIHRQAQADIDSKRTHAEALKAAHQWRSAFRRAPALKYRGQDIPHYFNFDFVEATPDGVGIDRYAFEWSLKRYDSQSSRCGSVNADEAHNRLYVTGYKGTGIPARLKEQAKAYRELHTLSVTSAIFCWKMPDRTWLADAPQVDIATLRAIKLPDDPVGPAPRKAGLVRYLDQHGYTKETDIFTPSAPHMYIEIQERNNYENRMRALGSWVAEIGGTCVVLAANQVKKFQREYPEIRNFREVIKEHGENFVKSLTQEEIFVLRDAGMMESIGVNLIEPEKVLDPEFRKVLSGLRAVRGSGKQTQWNTIMSLCNGFNLRVVELPESRYLAEVTAQAKKYPLLGLGARNYGYGARHNKGEFTEYVNSTYICREGLHLIPVL